MIAGWVGGGLDAWRSIANDCWVGGWGTGCLKKYS